MDNEREELEDLISLKWDEIKSKIANDARIAERERIKSHFDYCHSHCGHRQEIAWLRNELFGKD